MTSPLLEWRPIDTAPKDGSRVLLSEGVLVHVGRWRGNRSFGSWGLETPGLVVVKFDPTYWMPLPQSPKNERAV